MCVLITQQKGGWALGSRRGSASLSSGKACTGWDHRPLAQANEQV